jgi:sugar phosphate permease
MRRIATERTPITRRLMLLGGLAAIAYLVENGWQSWGAVHLHNTLHASPALAALAPAVFAASAAVGRFSAHGLGRAASRASLVGTGSMLAATGTLTAALAANTPLALAGIALAGVGTSVCAPTLIALAGVLTPTAPGAATATVITVAYLGFAFGPALVGGIAALSTLPTALCAVAGAALLLAATSRTLRGLSAVPD